MFNLNKTFSNIECKLELENGITTLDTGMSGNGKTFLASILVSHFIEEGIKYKRFDYDNTTDDVILSLSNKDSFQFLILDNFDLYVTQELINLLETLQNKYIVIVSFKTRGSYNFRDLHYIDLNYTSNAIISRRLDL